MEGQKSTRQGNPQHRNGHGKIVPTGSSTKKSDVKMKEVYTYTEGSEHKHSSYAVSSFGMPRTKLFPEFGSRLDELRIKSIEEYLRSEKLHFEARFNDERLLEFCESDDFEYIRYLGRGAFATVSMVRKVDSGLYYARKEMVKHFILLNNKVGEVKNEKRILQSLRFPFTVNLKYFYQDAINIYFLLPIMVAGELYVYIKKMGKFNEDLARFVLSQLVLALEYLHVLGLIHRDIKLENMLVDHFGYIKLSDFGMCKLIKHNRTFTICGTAEYLAPEVINHKGYGLAADWWSFGVIAFEICSGRTPFVAEEFLQIFYLISHNKYEMPTHFSYSFSNLIEHLLEADLSRRYGNLRDGVNDIKSHDFFKNTPWLELFNLTIDSPLLPIIKLPDREFFEPQTPPPLVTEDIKKDFDDHFRGF